MNATHPRLTPVGATPLSNATAPTEATSFPCPEQHACDSGRPSTAPRTTWMALAIVALTFSGLVSHGWRYNLMPRDNEWGETVLALHAVEQYREIGLRYGLIENVGTIAEPLLYTHNVNIGNIFYVALDAVGVTGLRGKQVATLLIFCTGLFLVYLTVAKYTASDLCGLFALALFCLDYRNVPPLPLT